MRLCPPAGAEMTIFWASAHGLLLTCKQCLKQYVGQTIDTLDLDRIEMIIKTDNRKFHCSGTCMQEPLFRHMNIYIYIYIYTQHIYIYYMYKIYIYIYIYTYKIYVGAVSTFMARDYHCQPCAMLYFICKCNSKKQYIYRSRLKKVIYFS